LGASRLFGQRSTAFVEDQLKLGKLRALARRHRWNWASTWRHRSGRAVEAPPTVASGCSASAAPGTAWANVAWHRVSEAQGELPAAAVVCARHARRRRRSDALPRNPLDVLAQQVVAMVANAPMSVDAISICVAKRRRFRELPRASFVGVLELLAGRYPSDEFSELRPRITWDRVSAKSARRAVAKRIAIVSGGTISGSGLTACSCRTARSPCGSVSWRRDGVRITRRRGVPARRSSWAHRRDHARSCW